MVHLKVIRRVCYIALVSGYVLAAFVPQSSGPDAVCQWPHNDFGPLDLSDARQGEHLRSDAEKVEGLAIRYADGHARPNHGHTMGEYRRTLDQCEANLFGAISEDHKVTPKAVRESIDKYRRTSLDTLVILFFGLCYGLCYGLLADQFARRIWLRFPPNEGRLPGIMATVAFSPVVSILGVVFGEGWWDAAETLRAGYGHLVDRSSRIPWLNHQPIIFAVGIALFWLVSWRQYRKADPALHWEDIDLEDLSMVVVRALVHGRIQFVKTECSEDELPLDPEFATVLRELKKNTSGTGLLFPSWKTGRAYHASPIQQDYIRPAGWCLVPCPECSAVPGSRCADPAGKRIPIHQQRRELAKKSKVGNVCWHTFRHTYRTWLDETGAPVGVQQKLMRHADISTTMNQYGNAQMEAKRKANSKVVNMALRRA